MRFAARISSRAATPALARMLVLEAPVVLGWKTWCNLEQKYEVAAFARCLNDVGR